ncbi:MAG: transposase, partial [Planctomyces sp.]
NQLKCVGDANFHGKPAKLWVGETRVVLDRPAKKSVGGVKSQKPGEPIELRFIVVEVRDEFGVRLGDWMLLSNLGEETASTEHLARCYYWRWRIESFFKWLKSHGHQMEHWGQHAGLSIARRLLIASMACVLVWGLMEDDSAESTAFKNVLIRLSGRQMKRSKPYTAPALLAGVHILLSTLATLEQIPLSKLKQMAELLPSLEFG